MTHPVSKSFTTAWRVWTNETIVETARDLAMQTQVPGLQVVDVEARVRDDLDVEEPVLALTVALDDPSPDQETWPLEAVQDLRETIRRKAAEAGLPYALSVQLRSANEPAADKAAASGDDLAADEAAASGDDLAERLDDQPTSDA